MQALLYVLILFLSFGGLALAAFIRHKKTAGELLVCPIGHSCHDVVHSDYSLFLGLPVELLGVFYYALIAVSYGAFLILPEFATPPLVFSILSLSTVALCFSLYLTFIQAFSLKQWCTWCLISASLCVVIFGAAVVGSSYNFVELLASHREFITVVHLFGFALGIGAATLTDVFFLKFLKDLRISEEESDILHTISQVIWFALAILVISGLALYLPETARLNDTPKFLVKALVILVIIINGAFLNLLIAPKLVKISFGKKHEHESGELHHLRKLAFALGAVSITSWYSAFILGMLKTMALTFMQLLTIYLVLLILAITASQIVERQVAKRD